MSEIEKIKRRINKRKTVIDINNEVKTLEQNSKSSKLFKLIMSFLGLYALFMSFAIYARKDENATIINSVFNTNINFSDFNRGLNKLLNLRVIDNNDINGIDQVVSSNVSYMSLGEDYYTSDGNLVVALDDGIVTYVNGKDENYTIIVEYDSGIRATYYETNEVNVFVNDRVYKDDIIASFDDKVQIIFIKDSQKLSYEEVVKYI